jgi:hypothetical protein
MNDENTEAGRGQNSTPSTDLSEAELQYDVEHRDWALQMIVGICNLSGIEVSVTLNLAGAYVAGHIVKPEVYFDGLTADFQAATLSSTPPGAGNWAKEMLERSISSMKELVIPQTNDMGAVGSEPRLLRPRYIHLRNARFFVPNDLTRPLHTVKGLWWRGKIESVNGFYFGMPFPK